MRREIKTVKENSVEAQRKEFCIYGGKTIIILLFYIIINAPPASMRNFELILCF